ncbi:MAG: hypothetical protein AB1515_05440 [Nitrospirota bacterium]
MTLCAGWMLAGLYLDGWAHRHFQNLETFFTPWHGALYSGFLALLVCLAWMLVHFRRPGEPWWQAIPPGYGLSLVGAAVFLAGGLGDLVWHTLLGIEVDLEALLSPTHLLLAIGGTLMGAGPFRAAWRRPTDGAAGLTDLLPMLFSLTFGWSVLTFFTQFAHPFVHPAAEGAMPANPLQLQRIELAAILLQSAIMTGLMLLATWRWALPFGSLTIVLTLNALLMSALEMHFYFVRVGLIAGVAADLLVRWLMPSTHASPRFRWFAALLPATFYATYFLAVIWLAGTWWPVPLWTGAIVMAGIVGWLLSYLLLPPGRPLPR